MNRRIATAASLLAAALLALPGACPAQWPHEMNYQVMLTDDMDIPLVNQPVSLMFRIYDAEVGGSLIWAEPQNATTNSIGVVSVALGSVNPFGFMTFDSTWLEVEVNGEIMSPRRRLVESPYAMVALEAGNAYELDNLPASSYAQYIDLSSPGVINIPSNPLEWTRLKNVPPGFADGVDNAGSGDGHSLDADDGDPENVVYVSHEGLTRIGKYFYYDCVLNVNGDNDQLGAVFIADSDNPLSVAAVASSDSSSGIVGNTGIGGGYVVPSAPSAVVGVSYGDGYAGYFNMSGTGGGIYCAAIGTGDGLRVQTTGSGYSGRFVGGSGAYFERTSGYPVVDATSTVTTGWGDVLYLSSPSGVYTSTWTLSSHCYEGNAGYFSKFTDDNAYAATVYGATTASEGLYVSGSIYSTMPLATAAETSRGTEAVFGVTSPEVEVFASGRAQLAGGTARVGFDRLFAESITGPQDLRITATPVGGWSALYLESVDASGFVIRSDSGDKQVEFNWVAVGRARGHRQAPQVTVPDDSAERELAETKLQQVHSSRPQERPAPETITTSRR